MILSQFVAEQIFSILLDANKSISKSFVDSLFEKKMSGHKDMGGFKNWMDVDMSKILTALNLIEASENSQVIHWYGPDCLNLAGVTNDVLNTIKNLPEVLHDSYKEYLDNFPHEFEERESAFFLTLIHDYKGAKGWNESKMMLERNYFDESDPEKNFKEYGFAMLKGRSWSYVTNFFV